MAKQITTNINPDMPLRQPEIKSVNAETSRPRYIQSLRKEFVKAVGQTDAILAQAAADISSELIKGKGPLAVLLTAPARSAMFGDGRVPCGMPAASASPYAANLGGSHRSVSYLARSHTLTRLGSPFPTHAQVHARRPSASSRRQNCATRWMSAGSATTSDGTFAIRHRICNRTRGIYPVES